MENVSIIVQARLTAKRLPNKVLLDICNGNCIDFLIHRLSKCKSIKSIIFAIPETLENDELYFYLKKKKCNLFRGSERDVADRYLCAAQEFSTEHIVRITADCPFSDPVLIDKMVNEYFNKGFDYFCNIMPPTYPDGFDIEIFRSSKLKQFYQFFSESDKEHVTTFFRDSSKIFKGNLASEIDQSSIRLTLDNHTDLKLMKLLSKKAKNLIDLNYLEIINLYNSMSDQEKFNMHYERNYGMKNEQ